MSLKSSLKPSSIPGRSPVKAKNSPLLKSNLGSANSPEKSELIKGVLKKNGYISDRNSPISENVIDANERDVEIAFQELDCSNIQALREEGDFEMAVESMLSEDRMEAYHHRLSVTSSLLKPTIAYLKGTYKGKKHDGIWRPPEGIISPPSAKLCRTTKAVETHKYDPSKRHVTPTKEKNWVGPVAIEKVHTLLHTEADIVFKETRMFNGGLKAYDETKSDVCKPTAAAIAGRYKKPDPSVADAAMWHPPEVLLPPSKQLLKTTTATEAGKWSRGNSRARTPEAKRELGWKKYVAACADISDNVSVISTGSAHSRSSSRPKSVDRKREMSSDRINALTSPNAALRASIDALAKAKHDKVAKPMKKQSIMSNQRILNPTIANLASQQEVEVMRTMIKPESDPWWEERERRGEGKIIPRSASRERFSSTPSKLHEQTIASKTHSAKKFTPAPVPSPRAKSPSPFIHPPSERLLKLTESEINRSRATSEARSLSARSNRSNTSRSSSITNRSERSHLSTISVNLLVPTESYQNSLKAKQVKVEAWKPNKRNISPDLIERLERKTASIWYNQWTGSAAEKEKMLELQRREKMLASTERAKTPDGATPKNILAHTAISSKLVRTKSPGRMKGMDPQDIGEGWVGGSSSINDGQSLGADSLTSLNYQKRTPTPGTRSNSSMCEQLERLHLHNGNRSIPQSGASSPVSESSLALA